MELLENFPDGEEVGTALFAGEADTVLHLPNPLTLPVIRVRMSNNNDDYITCACFLQVECFTGDHDSASDMARTCQQLTLASPATKVGPATIDSARTETGPVYADWGKPGVFRFIANYRLTFRRS